MAEVFTDDSDERMAFIAAEADMAFYRYCEGT